MKSSFLLLSLASVSLGRLAPRVACSADNCARAITGTRYAPSIQALHTSDCSSFMIQTITPATPTAYSTITPTSYSVVGSNAKRTAAPFVARDELAKRVTAADWMLDSANIAAIVALDPNGPALAATTTAAVARRQATQNPVNVPIYASACSGTVRYSSACSCAGITQVTSYAPTPATFTSTVYAQASIIPVCDPADNYGYHYDGGIYSPGPQAGISVNYQGALSPQACCAGCFAPGSSCQLYFGTENTCYYYIEVSGSHAPTDYCPYGQYGAQPAPGAFYGLGPCLINEN